jgi:hypothetical protein
MMHLPVLLDLLNLLDLYHYYLFRHPMGLLGLLGLLADTVVYIEYRNLYRADKDQWENIVYSVHMGHNMDYTTYLFTSMFL